MDATARKFGVWTPPGLHTRLAVGVPRARLSSLRVNVWRLQPIVPYIEDAPNGRQREDGEVGPGMRVMAARGAAVD